MVELSMNDYNDFHYSFFTFHYSLFIRQVCSNKTSLENKKKGKKKKSEEKKKVVCVLEISFWICSDRTNHTEFLPFTSLTCF